MAISNGRQSNRKIIVEKNQTFPSNNSFKLIRRGKRFGQILSKSKKTHK